MVDADPPQRVNRAKFKLPDSRKKDVTKPQENRSKPICATSPPATPSTSPSSAPEGGSQSTAPLPVVTPLRNRAAAPMSEPQAGVPGVLTGKLICFATDLHSVLQAEAERRVEAAGGKIGPSVGQRTSYLVLGGKMPDGRPAEESAKYQRFLQLRKLGKATAEVLTEADFLKMLPATGSISAASSAKQPPKTAVDPAPASPEEKPQTPFNWVDIFAPFQSNQLIGNGSTTQRLADWLRDWEDVVLRGRKKTASPSRPGNFENINARAALVSGPPGIGKTTTCRLVAQLHGGYEVLEYNASDARGQKVIQEMAEGIAQNSTISFSGQEHGKRKAVIIMDEVDGMGAGDKGGNAALIKMIKMTRNPIICICNDQHGQKVRSLASHCYDLKFSRPSKKEVALRCAEIARRQGLNIDMASLEALAESCGSDVRVVLNQMQMMTKGHKFGGKDQEVMLTPFEACRKLLNASEALRHTFEDRQNMFFVDYSMVGLLVHENYLRAVERKPASLEVLNRCAYSADLMTVGDIFQQRMHTEQEWSLLPDCAVVSCAYPAYVTNGILGYPGFPAALGKVSSLSKSRRLLMELQTHLRLSSTVSGQEVMTSSYADLLYRRLVEPLKQNNVKEVVGLLDAYGLRREHLLEHLTELRQHLGCQDMFKQVDAKVKAALTRELNTGSHAIKVVLPSKRRRTEAAVGDPENEAMDAEESQEEEEEKGSNLIKVKGKMVKSQPKSKGKKVKARPRPEMA